MPAYDLNGKVVLVTGGSRGIGFEAARQAHLRGASVALVDLEAESAVGAAERIAAGDGERAASTQEGGGARPRTLGIGADVTDPDAIGAAVAAAVERFGRLDAMVANAGIAPPPATARTAPAEAWRRVLDVNLIGAWNSARAALPQVVEHRGQVIFIGSIYSHANGFLASPYAVSKAGVEALGRALRAELTPHGASAGVVYFGWVDTDLVRDSLDRADEGRGARILADVLPAPLRRRIAPAAAGAALVRALEERAPRTFAPAEWRYISALRGLVGPLTDRRLERDPRIAEIVREVESRSPDP